MSFALLFVFENTVFIFVLIIKIVSNGMTQFWGSMTHISPILKSLTFELLDC